MHMNLTDEFLENIFHLLWIKDVMYKNLAQINIPDTVIFKNEQPSFWYFTSKNGEILRKSKKNMTNEAIQKHFLKGVKESGIVAYYMYQKKRDADEEGGGKWKLGRDGAEDSDVFNQENITEQLKKEEAPEKASTKPQMVFELLDREKFIDFLHN